ncbi:ketopantoate reductase family protein [Agrobacterium sp. LAD9]|uniref:ketopantoate reductase family protein n=1 Tax=Agrobacterium sp. LAD9 TaxID=2055153 RepID=UPI000D1D763E|nr:2-dehydropantoate 2-reductase [Agrobacterium sp. LAD9]
MKICIYGAGAVGGYLAGRLALAGAEVSILARGAHLEAIRSQGLLVCAHDGDHLSRPRAASDANELGPQDVVLVTTKQTALGEVAQGIGPLLGPQTSVIFITNGIPWWYFDGDGGDWEGKRIPEVDPGDVVRESIGIERTIGGLIYIACSVAKPGVVRSASNNVRLIIGEPGGALSERTRLIAQIFGSSGVTCEVTPDIRTEVWAKLMGNIASGPLCLLTRSTMAELLSDPVMRDFASDILEETMLIAEKLGRPVLGTVASRLERAAQIATKPSIVHDLELGRPLEIDAQLRVPLRFANELKISAPTLTMFTSLAVHLGRATGTYEGP